MRKSGWYEAFSGLTLIWMVILGRAKVVSLFGTEVFSGPSISFGSSVVIHDERCSGTRKWNQS